MIIQTNLAPDVEYRLKIFYIVLNVVMILLILLVMYADLLVLFKSRNIEVHELSIVPIDTQILVISWAYVIFMLYRIIYTSLRPIYSKSMHIMLVVNSITLIILNLYIAYTLDIHIIQYHIILLLIQIALTAWSIYNLTF